MPDVALHVNNTIYRFWKSVSITRGIGELAGSFGLSVTDRWSDGAGRWGGQPIRRFDTCRVVIDGETVITGHVDDVVPDYDEAAHAVSVSGRDATADLVDCSAVNKPPSWSGLKLDRIVAAICEPFKIRVTVATDMGEPFKQFAINVGEKAHAAIDRACKQRGVMTMSDGRGGLILCRAGISQHRGALEEGKNIKAARGNFSARERFSEYLVLGQQASLEGSSASDVAQGAGRATDPGVPRYRPLVIVDGEPGDAATLRQRAIWESTTRLGAGDAIEVTVYGWREQGDSGALWMPNRLVRVHSPKLDWSGNLLIRSVTWSHKDGNGPDAGTTAVLSLVRPEAFAQAPVTAVKGMW